MIIAFRGRGGLSLAAALLLACLAVVLLAAGGAAQPSGSQTIVFLNVGQGDAAVLSDGAGFTALIDGGKPAAGALVTAYLHQQGITRLNVILASHADSDHIGGLIGVLQDGSIAVDQVLYSGYPGTTATWDSFAAAVAARGLSLTAVQFPQVLAWGSLTVHILNPPSGLLNPETNDASVVALVSYGAIDALFPGDIDSTIEATVAARGTPVAAEVLKVAHHGSASSSSSAFLAAVRPQQAVISVGVNSYGHPSPLTLSRLSASGARTWRTDRAGNLLIRSDGAALWVSPQFRDIFVPILVKGIGLTPVPGGP